MANLEGAPQSLTERAQHRGRWRSHLVPEPPFPVLWQRPADIPGLPAACGKCAKCPFPGPSCHCYRVSSQQRDDMGNTDSTAQGSHWGEDKGVINLPLRSHQRFKAYPFNYSIKGNNWTGTNVQYRILSPRRQLISVVNPPGSATPPKVLLDFLLSQNFHL